MRNESEDCCTTHYVISQLDTHTHTHTHTERERERKGASLEDSTHRFIKCPIACTIWKYLSDIWQVLTRCYLRPQQWFFSQYVQNDSNDEMEM